MKTEKQQTAVEWLVNELRNGKEFNDELIEQAKEMEKEFLILAHINGQSEFDKGFYRQEVINNAEQYYKETYESKTKL